MYKREVLTMTAVIYARYSSDNQREESIEGQIRECTAYAEKNGITIVKHYIDRAISAKTDNRPEFQQMIKDSEKRLFDIVLVWKLDRFARNRYDSARYKTQLKKNGVKLMSATEIISEGPEGIILESVLEGYAEYYSADLSEKVIRGMTENALKGKFTGGAIPFGYTINADRRFEIAPLTAPFVAETFQRYNDGQTMREIRDWLNEKGIKNKRGGSMTFNTIQHMLSNRRYIGELKYRDILIPDAIPPIVSVELFDDVQEKMLKNKKAPARRKAEDDFLLTTKLHCGYCGALMFGESGTSRTGEVHRYYKCATAKKKKGCKKKTVRKQWLEDLVVNQTMQLVKDDAAMESIIAKVMELQNKENTNIPLYEKQLRDAESGIQNMLNAIQAGILTSSTKERLEQLEETKRELEARIAEEKLAKPKVTEEFIRFWLLRFRKLDMNQKDQRQALVDTFINSIYLYDDKVLITFNYKEGTQTIPFEKVEESKAKGNGSDFDCVTAACTNGEPEAQKRLFGGDKKALEHILQRKGRQRQHQDAPVAHGVVQQLSLCAQQHGDWAQEQDAQHGQHADRNKRRQHKHGKIAVGFFLVALAQRDAYDGAAAGAQHKADSAQHLRQRHDEVDRRKGRFAHKVGDTQAVHDAVDGGEQHGADAGQHEPQQAGIGKVVGQLDGFLWHSSSFLNFTYAKRPDKNHRSGAFPLLLRHYGAHSLREARTMTSYPAFQLR